MISIYIIMTMRGAPDRIPPVSLGISAWMVNPSALAALSLLSFLNARWAFARTMRGNIGRGTLIARSTGDFAKIPSCPSPLSQAFPAESLAPFSVPVARGVRFWTEGPDKKRDHGPEAGISKV